MCRFVSCFQCLLLAFATTLITSASFSTLMAQDPEVSSEEKNVAEEPELSSEAPDRVEVKPVARDSEIKSRLSEILLATNRFNSPSVEVTDSVVFLEGEAKELEFKQWATDLAASTQDVAAVVNRMSVAEKSMWDFSEAYSELKSFRNSTVQAIPIILFGLIVLLITLLLARLTGAVSNNLLRKRVPNHLLRWVASRIIMLPILIFGLYLILRVSGLTQLALTVLGGTGLIGLIIGIAFQDIAENFLASILISLQQPFRVGDHVRIESHEGIVQRVTTRGTTLLTHDGNHVQIPNANVYKTVIENFTANPLRRIQFKIGIGYDDPTTEAQEIVLERVKTHKAVLNDPPPKVLLEELGASTINLIVFIWVDGTTHDVHSVRSSCMRIVKQALMKAGISLPDEAREVIFPNGVPVEMASGDKSKHAAMSTPTAPSKNESSDDFSTKQDASINSRGNQSGEELRRPTPDFQPEEADESEAEGNMMSEMEDLQKQAEHSWLPGKGDDILLGEPNRVVEEGV